MNPFVISGLMIFITSLMLGVITLVKGKKSHHFTWFLFCLAVAVWGGGGFMFAIQNDVNAVLLWIKIAHIGVTLIPLTFLYFAFFYFDFKNKFILGFPTAIAVIFLIIILFYVDKFLELRYVFDQFYFWKRINLFYDLYLVYFWSIVTSVFFIFSWKYQQETGIRKEQIKYVIIGTSIGFVGGIFNFSLAYVDIYPYANYLIVFFPLIITYSMIRNRFLDIRFVFKNYVVYLFSLFTVLCFAAALRLITGSSLQFTRDFFTDLIIISISISIFPFVRIYYAKIANKYFFSSLYDSQAIISELVDKLSVTLEVSKINTIVAELLKKSFNNKIMSILLFDKDDKEKFEQFIYFGNQMHEVMIREIRGYLREKFMGTDEIIFVDEYPFEGKGGKGTLAMLDKLEVDLIIPLGFKNGISGVVLLGRKESEEIYNTRDIKVLDIISAQASVALENALLYEETRNFNFKLKREVALATSDLKKANKKLMKLDEQKSEFITLVSHQLRTPLTAMKLYLGMMDLDKLDEKGREKNKEHIIAIKGAIVRMLFLVNNFLNVARIESGKLKISPTKANVEEVIKLSIAEVIPLSREKNCDIIYKSSGVLLPPISIDLNLFHQVIHNLLTNAIKYSDKPECSIEVTTRQEEIELTDGKNGEKKMEECVIISVKDNGIGIPKDIQSEIFKKHVRAENAKDVTTEGTGLGLYLSYQIMKQSGGKIWFESEENVGTTFYIAIPFSGMIEKKGEKSLVL